MRLLIALMFLVLATNSYSQSRDTTAIKRAYTVHEIDKLRQVCGDRWLFGTTCFDCSPGLSRAYKEVDKDRAVEEMVRTYMVAGITAEDILEADREKCLRRKK